MHSLRGAQAGRPTRQRSASTGHRYVARGHSFQAVLIDFSTSLHDARCRVKAYTVPLFCKVDITCFECLSTVDPLPGAPSSARNVDSEVHIDVHVVGNSDYRVQYCNRARVSEVQSFGNANRQTATYHIHAEHRVLLTA